MGRPDSNLDQFGETARCATRDGVCCAFAHSLFGIAYLITFVILLVYSESQCGSGMFMCEANTKPRCVNTSYVCDGYFDCYNGSDEEVSIRQVRVLGASLFGGMSERMAE